MIQRQPQRRGPHDRPPRNAHPKSIAFSPPSSPESEQKVKSFLVCKRLKTKDLRQTSALSNKANDQGSREHGQKNQAPPWSGGRTCSEPFPFAPLAHPGVGLRNGAQTPQVGGYRGRAVMEKVMRFRSPVCQEELYDPGRNVSINSKENPILTPERAFPDVRLGYTPTRRFPRHPFRGVSGYRAWGAPPAGRKARADTPGLTKPRSRSNEVKP